MKIMQYRISLLFFPCHVILHLFLYFAGTAQVDLYGPELTSMPSPLTHFSNSVGVTLTCFGKGPPPLQVTWLSSSLEELPQIPGIRERLQNGSLHFNSFKAEEYIPSVHNAEYRCSVRNPVGTFLSSVFTVRAIVDHPFEVVVRARSDPGSDGDWMEGSPALLSCDVTPSFYSQFVKVIGWKSIDQFGHEREITTDDTRYRMSLDGSLLIFSANYQQLFVCIGQNELNRKVQTSQPFLLKAQAAGSGGIPPKPIFLSGTGSGTTKQVVIDSMTPQDLLCLAVANPPPTFRWGKYEKGKLVPVTSPPDDVVALGPILRISGHYELATTSSSSSPSHNTASSVNGTYRCEVSNGLATTFSVNFTLLQRESPELRIDPPRVLASNGQSVEFTCRVKGYREGDHSTTPFNFIWFKDGRPLVRSSRVKLAFQKLTIFGVQLGDQGVYQCFTEITSSSPIPDKSGENSAKLHLHASAMLLFRSSAPDLVHTFISQSLQPGPSVSLKCSAVGNPIPRISWFIDGVMVSEGVQSSLSSSSPDYHSGQARFWSLQQHTRFSIGPGSGIGSGSGLLQTNPLQPFPASSAFSSSSGSAEVVSYLNISEVHVEDSGLYQCTASNLVGTVSHSARLNIYGAIFVKEMRALTLVAGHTVHIPCLYGGYPVDKIIWQKDSRTISDSGKRTGAADQAQRYTVLANGTLQIARISTDGDKGRYTCVVSNRKGEVASGSVDVNVMRPPVISAFKFDENLREGQRTSVSCNVISGDLPIEITWLKDGQKISSYLNVTTNRVRFLSVLLFDELRHEHSGEYECRAENAAKLVKMAAKLLVRVPPKWIREPQNTKVILGSDQSLPCSATGVPPPTISWFRDTSGMKSVIRTNHKFQVLPDGTLVVAQVEESDRSQYICEAVNGIGPGISRSIRFDVIIPAKVSARLRSVLVAEGAGATLQCQIRGDRPVQVMWKKGDLVIKEQKKSEGVGGGKQTMMMMMMIPAAEQRVLLQTVSEVNSSVLLAQLHIEPSELEDTGEYLCFASNQYGHDQDAITLQVKARPSHPENFMVEEIGSRYIRLRWTTPSQEGGMRSAKSKLKWSSERVPVTYFILQWKRSGGGMGKGGWETSGEEIYNATVLSPTTQFVIEGLLPVTNYDIRLFAGNDIGHSLPTDPLAVLTLPEAPSGSPQNVSAIPIGPKSVMVRWEPPQPNMQHGQILGYQVIAVLQSLTSGSTESSWENRTTVVDQKWEQQSELKGLRPNSQYRISVRAYNSAGMGPESPYIFIQTPEGAPDTPPLNLQCEPLSPKSLQVQWEPPPFHLSNGQILGYKVIYIPVESDKLGEKPEVKKTSNKETTLHGLRSYTTYSVKTLAYTVGGESETSEPVLCTTEEDVPEEPADIKVMTSSPTSALVSWLPPASPNGVITKYTILWKSDDSDQVKQKEYVPLPHGPAASSLLIEEQPFQEIRRLRETHEYTFWVVAHTNSGAGRGSRKESLKITHDVPAKIASFPVTRNTVHEQSIRLPCKTVGIPSPRVTWQKNHVSLGSSASQGLPRNGSLLINRVKDEDEGVYTCHVENDFGFDEVEHRIIISRAPSKVALFIGYMTDSTMQIHWDPPEKADPPLTGYVLHYQRVPSAGSSGAQEWKVVKLGPRLTSYALENLPCGSSYKLKMFAENAVGKGESSEVISARTNGNPPESTPRLTEILDGNGTIIRIDLGRWPDGGCPINNFQIEYKRLSGGLNYANDNGASNVGGVADDHSTATVGGGASQWRRIYKRDNTTRMLFLQTQLNAKYKIRVKVENDAGSVIKTFAVESHPDFFLNYAKVLERVEVEERMNGGSSRYVPFYTDPHVVVPIVSALICTFAVAVCILMLIKRKSQMSGKSEWKFNASTSQQSWLTSASSTPGNHHRSTSGGGVPGKCGENGKCGGGDQENSMSIYATLNSTKPIPMTIRDSTVRLQSFGQHDNYDAPTHLISGNYLKRGSRRKSNSSPPIEEMCMQQVSCQMEPCQFASKIEPPREFRSTVKHQSQSSFQFPNNSDSDDNENDGPQDPRHHHRSSSRRGTPGTECDNDNDGDDDDSILYHDYSCPYQYSSSVTAGAAPTSVASGGISKRRESGGGNSKGVSSRPGAGAPISTLQKKRSSTSAKSRARGPEYFD